MQKLIDASARRLVRMALAEDLGRRGDLTTRYFIPRAARLHAIVVAKERGIVCGLDMVREVFHQAAPEARFRPLVRDGTRVRPGMKVAEIFGPREILTAERTALNFLQRLSGVATLTRAYADRLRGTRTSLLDTRKTIPGWRALDKYAVRCGGGVNHRFGLYDMVMLKDNHLEWTAVKEHALKRKISGFRKKHPEIPILMEAKTPAQVELALNCGADIILLDNMPLARLRREIRRIRARSSRLRIEVSGGVNFASLRGIGKLGPDRISVGRVTHSAPALDFSLELRQP